MAGPVSNCSEKDWYSNRLNHQNTIQSYHVFKVQLSGNSTMRVNFDKGDNVLLSISENSMDLLKKAKVYEL